MSHPLLARLRDHDPALRARACIEVAEDPSAVLLLDAVGAALSDPNARVCRAATDALVALSPRHPEVRELLQRARRQDEPRTRWGAIRTLARLGPPEPGWLPTIVETLASERADLRWAAARMLVDLGRMDPQTLAVAIALARSDERPRVRRMALFCLRELAPDDPEVVETFAQAAQDPKRQVRQAAALSAAALSAAALSAAARVRLGRNDRGQNNSASSE